MVKNFINKLHKNQTLTKEEYIFILDNIKEEEISYLKKLALETKQEHYGDEIFLRGIIEFSNYCKNDCLYCGIRVKNQELTRYRLTLEEILLCCEEGYKLGMRTFVLQSGEDSFFTCDKIIEIIQEIKKKYTDCAITLSIGERTKEEYKKLFNAGADRFLLREETANKEHYKKLHSEKMSFENRQECLYNLKEIGYHTGAGFMVDSPYQTNENLAEDLIFLEKLQPHMVGIGPFIPHNQSPFKDMLAGTVEKTTVMIALVRLLLPCSMLPSTTALETIAPQGRIEGFLAGANVIMVNISPSNVKKDYLLYNDKAFIKTSAEDSVKIIKKELEKLSMNLVVSIGNPKVFN